MRARVTLANVEKAMAGLADIIETHPNGEVFWPIFERLERMHEKLVSRKSRLDAARARVSRPPSERPSTSAPAA